MMLYKFKSLSFNVYRLLKISSVAENWIAKTITVFSTNNEQRTNEQRTTNNETTNNEQKMEI
jgi:hypothetical protein